MFAIEVHMFDPATNQFNWVSLRPSGLCNRPYKYNTREKAQRVVDVCYPAEHVLKARVVEAI